MTFSLADMKLVTDRLERDIHGITSNEQKLFNMVISICFTMFEAWWETICIQALGKTIEQCGMQFRYPKMHTVSHISESIGGIDLTDNSPTDTSEQLRIPNVKVVYRSSNNIKYIPQTSRHNDLFTSLEYMEMTLLYLELEGRYRID
jgi:hypothetical protein